MPIVAWNNALSVGISEIDEEHKRLIEIINELYDGMKKGVDQDLVFRTLSEMIRYAALHFGTEERYMFKFDYPEYQEHREEHLNFFSQIIVFIYECKKSDEIISMDMLTFLKKWLVNHIQVTDKKYSSFFQEKGIS